MDCLVNNLNVLALIPARGGSKSIPQKNIRSFAGHPLIAYSIVAGLAAQTVNRVIVSTDDEEIATVAPPKMERLIYLFFNTHFTG